MTRARDLRKRERRGDLRQFGVTVAIRQAHMDEVAQGGKDALREGLKDLAEQAIPALKAYVGGAPMRSEPAVNLNGPEDDPIQGPIYGLSVAALFDVTELGVDCPARLLVMQDDGQGAVDVARTLEGEQT